MESCLTNISEIEETNNKDVGVTCARISHQSVSMFIFLFKLSLYTWGELTMARFRFFGVKTLSPLTSTCNNWNYIIAIRLFIVFRESY